MASATDIANPDQAARRAGGTARPRTPPPRRLTVYGGGGIIGSSLSRTIIVLNLVGLVALIAGALILGNSRQDLIRARLESLTLQGELIANVIDRAATADGPPATLNARNAVDVLTSLFIPDGQRARLHGMDGRLLADSGMAGRSAPGRVAIQRRGVDERRAAEARLALTREVAGAAAGTVMSDLRLNEAGEPVVSVSIPIRRGRAVLGVLTLEAADVQAIVASERAAMTPFILLAVGLSLLSSLLLIQTIAVPVLRLARAADRVRLSRARAISLPDLARRQDELGDLTRSLEAMTAAASERMAAIERFAADVAHELRNPMTSIRSAVETLDLVKTGEQRQRMIAILQHDVDRMDRLITDISNASRLDAELAREAPSPVDIVRLLSDICAFYGATGRPGQAHVNFVGPEAAEPLMIVGRETPLGQVVRNLVDNAISFSPPGGVVRVHIRRDGDEALIQVDDEGPGVPPENLETIFERFYTARPKGAAFGGNSGLGLAIARQIIEAHGGRIWAENRGHDSATPGASFRIALPLA
jgi:two-component system sensor histidine kinase ChvG